MRLQPRPSDSADLASTENALEEAEALCVCARVCTVLLPCTTTGGTRTIVLSLIGSP